uniref:SGNH hydrolase-type esterase domain-containing protein n=1 Tax=Florenciella parvula TaxID=236787 RepID=A0A7S2GBI9_9STRA|mmetsp:Transcript_7833/g.16485  ORF Transcript_7833/g.16485 Transcript_7833/m.16485 type:complete len:228 (+) Transcript_7833:71-754(+)|eukprot:CAMPEP_0182537004 /NCGR_PEP_ID=MMETSP1323-20130603/21162_1 /TAXON_ID=236787 /ORGANISM="Florenciella parvula, Strain RCC1693" /LENGTH=227 /DNA_ID=CAMNT_0024747313 /DNA_START=66 /DNA_END=749 /DNA_ORIENTATION=+
MAWSMALMVMAASVATAEGSTGRFKVTTLGDSVSGYVCNRTEDLTFAPALQGAFGSGYEVEAPIWSSLSCGDDGVEDWHASAPVQEMLARANGSELVVLMIGSDLRRCDYSTHRAEFETRYSQLLRKITAMPRLLSVYVVVPPSSSSAPEATAELRETLEAVTQAHRNQDDTGHGELYTVPPIIDASDVSTVSSCEGLTELTERIAAAIAADMSELSEDIARAQQQW